VLPEELGRLEAPRASTADAMCAILQKRGVSTSRYLFWSPVLFFIFIIIPLSVSLPAADAMCAILNQKHGDQKKTNGDRITRKQRRSKQIKRICTSKTESMCAILKTKWWH
jgi:hypothetical protein